MLDRLRAELAAAIRALVATPAPSLAAILTLAVAVGVNLAMAGLIGRALLRPPDHVIIPAGVYTLQFNRPGRPSRHRRHDDDVVRDVPQSPRSGARAGRRRRLPAHQLDHRRRGRPASRRFDAGDAIVFRSARRTADAWRRHDRCGRRVDGAGRGAQRRLLAIDMAADRDVIGRRFTMAARRTRSPA